VLQIDLAKITNTTVTDPGLQVKGVGGFKKIAKAKYQFASVMWALPLAFIQK